MELCQEHVKRSRSEPGNLSYDLHVHTEDVYKVVYTEEWEDLESLQKHVEASKDFIKELSRASPQAPKVKVFESTVHPDYFLTMVKR